MSFNGVGIMLNNVTAAPVTGETFKSDQYEDNKTFQATVTGTGAVTATVIIQCSNDGVNWLTLGTITLSGTNSASDGFTSAAAWAYHRAIINAGGITGTGATVKVLMGS